MSGRSTVLGIDGEAHSPGVLGSSWTVDERLRELRVGVRSQVTNDEGFLLSLFRSRKSLELGYLPWSEAQKDVWVFQQWQAQEQGYRSEYPKANWLMVCSEDRIFGRLVLDVGVNGLTVVDIALSPSHQGLGIGSALFSALLRRADQLGLNCHLQVEPHNPAQRLYTRMGFVARASEGFHVVMERSPSPLG